MDTRVAGQERRREAADDQSSARGAAFGGGSPGAAQEAPTESNAEGERGAEGQSLFGVIVPKGNARHLPFQDGKPANEFGGEFESRGSERTSEQACPMVIPKRGRGNAKRSPPLRSLRVILAECPVRRPAAFQVLLPENIFCYFHIHGMSRDMKRL